MACLVKDLAKDPCTNEVRYIACPQSGRDPEFGVCALHAHWYSHDHFILHLTGPRIALTDAEITGADGSMGEWR